MTRLSLPGPSTGRATRELAGRGVAGLAVASGLLACVGLLLLQVVLVVLTTSAAPLLLR